jgi:branched-chain amino acid transport system permease protein
MFNLELILQQVVYGIIMGSMYVLMAVGFSLIWGIMDMLNFAHGEFYMLGAYFTYYILTFFGINPFFSIFLVMAILFVVGIFLFRLTIAPLQNKPGWQNNTVIVTLGVSISLQNLAQIVFGERYKGIERYFNETLKFHGLAVGVDRIFIFALGLSLVIALWIIIKRTRVGLSMRAISQDREAASLMGINNNQIYIITFGISGALAGAAGGLLAPIYFIYPTVGFMPLLMAFVVVILGGLGSVEGAIYAGFILGIIESISVLFLSSAWKDVVIFMLMILVLVFKPMGLCGIKKV